MNKWTALLLAPIAALDFACEVIISLAIEIIHYIRWDFPEILSSYFDNRKRSIK